MQNVRELFPIPKLSCKTPQCNMAVHSGELSVQAYLDAFLGPDQDIIRLEELTNTEYVYAIDIDARKMSVDRMAVGMFLRNMTPKNFSNIPDGYVPRVSICYLGNNQSLVLATSFWMLRRSLYPIPKF